MNAFPFVIRIYTHCLIIMSLDVQQVTAIDVIYARAYPASDANALDQLRMQLKDPRAYFTMRERQTLASALQVCACTSTSAWRRLWRIVRALRHSGPNRRLLPSDRKVALRALDRKDVAALWPSFILCFDNPERRARDVAELEAIRQSHEHVGVLSGVEAPVLRGVRLRPNRE